MAFQITVYRLKDFIKETPTGEVSLEKSIKAVWRLARAAENYPDHNVLLDLRDIEGYLPLNEVWAVIDEFAQRVSIFKNKIAILVPIDEKRMGRAMHGASFLRTKGLQTEVFVNFEDTIEWLSSVSQIDSDLT